MVQKKEKESKRERGVNVTQPMWRNVRRLAADLDITASEVVRRALADFLKRHGMAQ